VAAGANGNNGCEWEKSVAECDSRNGMNHGEWAQVGLKRTLALISSAKKEKKRQNNIKQIDKFWVLESNEDDSKHDEMLRWNRYIDMDSMS